MLTRNQRIDTTQPQTVIQKVVHAPPFDFVNYTQKQRGTQTKRRNTLIPKKAQIVQTVTKIEGHKQANSNSKRSEQLSLRSAFETPACHSHPSSRSSSRIVHSSRCSGYFPSFSTFLIRHDLLITFPNFPLEGVETCQILNQFVQFTSLEISSIFSSTPIQHFSDVTTVSSIHLLECIQRRNWGNFKDVRFYSILNFGLFWAALLKMSVFYPTRPKP